jgi:arabinogalactan oligomer/maltooligosaccharide transport system substrate-binding protein
MLSLQKTADKDTAVFARAADKAQPMPAIPEMQSVWTPLGKAYASIVRGSDADSTMTKAGQAIASSIKAAGD